MPPSERGSRIPPPELPSRRERNPTTLKIIERLSSAEALFAHNSEAVRLALDALKLPLERRNARDGLVAIY